MIAMRSRNAKSTLDKATFKLLIFDFFDQAFAEALHEDVRTELWGYASSESMSAGELHKIHYQVTLYVCVIRLLQPHLTL